MISFLSDYSQGAHPKVLEALERTNLEHTDGYGLDPHCERAAGMVRELIGREDCAVHMMIGGTSCNITLIAAALRPYESVIAASTGHIYVHETGAIEATGHRVVTVPAAGGKLTPALIDAALAEFQDEHTAKPAMVYISQPTELGTVYSRAELAAVSAKCREEGLLLYADGARLGCALTCAADVPDVAEIARLCDAFYIGGTKNGALFGEALVINAPAVDDHFRWMIKRQGGMLAKGRLIGVQVEALLEGGTDGLYYKIAARSNALADRLRAGLAGRGIGFAVDSPTNQVFPLLPAAAVKELAKDFAFYEWAPEKDGMIPIRLVTGWGTTEEEVDKIVDAICGQSFGVFRM